MKKDKIEIEKTEYEIDAAGKILGRLAVEIANLLRGRNKPDFLPRLTPKNIIIVTNTDKIKFSGKKLRQKIYYRHSGYMGGLKELSLEEMMAKDSREVLRLAVYGMLPKNRQRDRAIVNLKMYKKDK
ncbi:MAG: 50S ribosomal protein L13 [Parcubacteria group bacterium GW2011_GWC2_42_6]|nr:MAG: 50S ribosomal protein L13 [Parcubacteria group bacterium GW2011_GWC2_42_6]